MKFRAVVACMRPADVTEARAGPSVAVLQVEPSARAPAAVKVRVGAERRASSQGWVEQADVPSYLSGAEERFELDRERDHKPSLEKIERERERPHWRQTCGYPISERSWE